ncbi:uncharacterized protein LOC144020311 [Festucalex cinctus]
MSNFIFNAQQMINTSYQCCHVLSVKTKVKRTREASKTIKGEGTLAGLRLDEGDWKTQHQQNRDTGVAASNGIAETDLDRMNTYKEIIKRVEERQSRAGNTLKHEWGDDGDCWGLKQAAWQPTTRAQFTCESI